MLPTRGSARKRYATGSHQMSPDVRRLFPSPESCRHTDAADKGDYAVVDDLFKIAQNPYAEHEAFERWAGVTPDEFKNKKLSCSS